MKPRFLVLIAILLSACAMPSTTVRTTDTRPGLSFVGASAGATVYVDGILAGPAEQYDGQPGVLTVEPGTHEVAVKAPDGSVLIERAVFVESEIKTIKVH